MVRKRHRSEEAGRLAGLLAASARAESAGRLSEALLELETALVKARGMNPPPPDLAPLRARRDALARREAVARLEALESPGPATAPGADPGREVGEALTLQARARKDAALAGLEGRIAAAIDRLRARWSEADVAAALAAVNAGSPARALELCDRADRTAGLLSQDELARARAAARNAAARVIAGFGAVIEPIQGHYTLGSPRSYEAELFPLIRDALTRRGYLPRPAGDAWDDLWSSTAPYRFTLQVAELQEDHYLGSPNRVSRVETTVVLNCGDSRLWYDNPKGLTEVPLPRMPAYLASRVASSEHRSAEFEKLLYESARERLRERVTAALKTLPAHPNYPGFTSRASAP
jgi:hypothetical protein